MKKLLTTLVLVMVLVCAFCVVSYAVGNFELTYTNTSNTVSTKTFERFTQIVYQVNNTNTKDGKFYVKLLDDASDGYSSGNTTFSKGTVEIDLNGKTLTTNTLYTISGENTDFTIKKYSPRYISVFGTVKCIPYNKQHKHYI